MLNPMNMTHTDSSNLDLLPNIFGLFVIFRTQATNISTTANYTNVACDSLPYNMALATLAIESNSK